MATSGRISSKLRLKGKGHEFSDASKLLSYYQLWLDTLYPRAKFLDGLQLVEKAGHSKTLQRQRKDWIDEGKPGYIRDRERRKEEADSETRIFTTEGLPESEAQSGIARATSPDSDYGEGLFVPETHVAAESAEPDEDELDALLAGQNPSNPASIKHTKATSEDEDDVDALLAEHNARTAKKASSPSKPTNDVSEFEQEEDEDELDELLNKYHTSNAPPQSKANGAGDPEHILDVRGASSGTGDEETESMGDPQLPAVFPPHHGSTLQDDDDLHQDSNPSILPLSSPIANEMDMEFITTPTASKTTPAPITTPQLHDDTSAHLPNDDLDIFSTHATGEDEIILPGPRLLDTPSKNDDSQGNQSAEFFSSSPMPNDVMEMDDLDALMDGRKR